MNFQSSVLRTTVFVAVLMPLALAAMNAREQNSPQQTARGAALGTKIAVINIDLIAQESSAGKAMIQRLKEENDRLAAERARRQQEISDLTAKMTSEVLLSINAREQLSRDIERKRTDAQRWLEDAQRKFQEKQQQEEEEFNKTVMPIVEKVAKEKAIATISRWMLAAIARYGHE